MVKAVDESLLATISHISTCCLSSRGDAEAGLHSQCAFLHGPLYRYGVWQ